MVEYEKKRHNSIGEGQKDAITERRERNKQRGTQRNEQIKGSENHDGKEAVRNESRHDHGKINEEYMKKKEI